MPKRISNSGYERNTAGRSVGPHLSPVIYAVAVGAKLGLRQWFFFFLNTGHVGQDLPMAKQIPITQASESWMSNGG